MNTYKIQTCRGSVFPKAAEGLLRGTEISYIGPFLLEIEDPVGLWLETLEF